MYQEILNGDHGLRITDRDYGLRTTDNGQRTTGYGLRTNGMDIKHGLKEATECLKSQFNVRLQNNMTILTPFIKMNLIYQKDPPPPTSLLFVCNTKSWIACPAK